VGLAAWRKEFAEVRQVVATLSASALVAALSHKPGRTASLFRSRNQGKEIQMPSYNRPFQDCARTLERLTFSRSYAF
jgi:hypothetical protein